MNYDSIMSLNFNTQHSVNSYRQDDGISSINENLALFSGRFLPRFFFHLILRRHDTKHFFMAQYFCGIYNNNKIQWNQKICFSDVQKCQFQIVIIKKK